MFLNLLYFFCSGELRLEGGNFKTLYEFVYFLFHISIFTPMYLEHVFRYISVFRIIIYLLVEFIIFIELDHIHFLVIFFVLSLVS